MPKTYVIGHRSPDLDSVAAAIAYADYKNKTEATDDYTPALAGELNRETAYVLDKYGIKAPEILSSASGQTVVLVDHNETGQAVDGLAEAKILEVLDHHMMEFKYAEPIAVTVRPWGSSCSIIYDLYKKNGISLEADLAGLMLSAVLVDTVITKSPTTTEADKEIIVELAKIAHVGDWRRYGMELFKVRASVSELSAAEIIKSDFKDFTAKAGKIGIGQVETVDMNDFTAREGELLEVLGDLKKANGYHSTILFITDIINEGSKFLVATDDTAGFEQAFGVKLEEGKVYIEGIISRKKQVAPKLLEVFDK